MKSLFLVLLIANLTAGAWLLLQEPVGVVREPGRMDLQIDQGRVQILTEAQVAKARQKAESDAAVAAAAATASASAGAVVAPATAGAGVAPGPTPAAGAAPLDMPLASCIDIGPFASESATRRIRARLVTAGLAEHVATNTADKVTRLRITGVDAAQEAQVHVILQDFSRQEITHCTEGPAAR